MSVSATQRLGAMPMQGMPVPLTARATALVPSQRTSQSMGCTPSVSTHALDNLVAKRIPLARFRICASVRGASLPLVVAGFSSMEMRALGGGMFHGPIITAINCSDEVVAAPTITHFVGRRRAAGQTREPNFAQPPSYALRSLSDA